jgi:hypothetical protein
VILPLSEKEMMTRKEVASVLRYKSVRAVANQEKQGQLTAYVVNCRKILYHPDEVANLLKPRIRK